ncbi:MAG: gamma carbonic anhydrase family protein [Burkholderiaceae bacterium]|nr:gamma carbonic anhydrase family protein [Burkholderiaceae bacterium]MCD8517599.1 gamma carbonic anhydrase family protein [Burkholderiaceae bacterium]MCD8537393.1 gamma carbonic anhydrase family protein [Burkholderiaceae bacterium]MCD8565551.1 gamma carbonic anhydrase family protein [Burkholderiaceae bacterium]
MPIYQLDGLTPQIDPLAYVHESAVIIGDVRIGPNASIWPNASIRGDNIRIEIKAGSNVQEGCVLHVDPDTPLTIHENVTVGHQAMLHGCTIHSGTLIGMQAIILNNAVIGKNCLIGAGAIVPEGREIPDGSLVIGVGKVARTLSEEEIANLHANNKNYQERAQHYAKSLKRIG